MPITNTQDLTVELIEKEVFAVELKTIDIIPKGNDLITNNFIAISAPTVNNGSGDGYSVGSSWINVFTDKSYICVDATTGSAIWRETDITTHETLYNHADIHPKELIYDSDYKCFNVND